MTSEYLPVIVLAPLAGALVNGLVGRHLPKRWVTFFALGSVAISFVGALFALEQLLELRRLNPEDAWLSASLWGWIESGTINVSLSFLLDPLSAVMLLVVTGVGGLIHIFSIGYMRSDQAYWRYFSYLNLFMFSMLLLILGKNLLVLFIGWEGVGLCSYLLIGFWYDDMDKAKAGQKAFVTNRIGDFAFLIGTFILMWFSQGDVDFHRLEAVVGEGGALFGKEGWIALIAILMLVGATGKSAQIPLFVWLPDAMAGPTPVSALIHAATMVTAGVYMMCRLGFLFAASPTAMATVAIIGGATALFAATIALVQNDIKKVLAYSTVSQIGYMVLAVGVGGFVAAIFHLMTHAFFKACLFLGSGQVIHALHHEQDIRKMGGLKARLPWTARTFWVATYAITGLPLMAGFFSKDEILFTAFTASHSAGVGGAYKIAFALGLIAALCTAFYMWRLYYLTFEGEFRGDQHAYDHAHEEWVMNGPLIALAFLAAVGGFLGLPEGVFHGGHVLHSFMEPVLAPAMAWFTYSHEVAVELGLMGLSVAIAIGGWLVARRMYKVPAASLPTAPVDSAWHRLLANKYYVDEIYAATLLKPLHGLAGLFHRVGDVRLIDGLLVNGTAKVIAAVGDYARRVQNGDVQAYVTAVVVGVAALLLFFR